MFAALALSALLATGAQAHFRLDFPPTRGPFNADGSLGFCGGYNDANATRTVFPLNDGYINVRQNHENWTAAVTIAVGNTADSFEDFGETPNENYVRYWAAEFKAGNFCIPINVADSGVEGVADGVNATLQVMFNGPDGQLFQCADVTLSANATLPEDSCKNSTKEASHASGSYSADAPGASGEADDDGHALRGSVVSALALGMAGVVAAVANAL